MDSTPSDEFVINAHRFSGTEAVISKVDDVYLYRTALDDTELFELFDPSSAVPEITFQSASQSVDEEDPPIVVPVFLSSAQTGPVTVDVSVSGSTATEGIQNDFVLNPSTLTFLAGSTTPQAPLTLSLNNDQDVEGDETVVLRLTNESGATIGQPDTHTITIKDDDTPEFSIDSLSMPESDAAQSEYNFMVTLSLMVASAVSVDFATEDGTATLVDNDYNAANGTLTFSPGGALTQQVTVAVVGDTKEEEDESFSILLSNPKGGARISSISGIGTGTIENDDMTIIDLIPDLIGHWALDETSWNGTSGEVIDSSGSNNHGTAVGDVQPTENGIIGGAASFGGTNGPSSIVVQNQEFEFNSPFTLAAWVYPGKQGKTVHRLTLGSHDDFLVYVWVDGSIRYWIRNSPSSSPRVSRVRTGRFIPRNDWTHIACTFDGGSVDPTLKIYINGNEVYSVPSANIVDSAPSDEFILNAHRFSGTEAVISKVDDVYLYARALASPETSSLFAPSSVSVAPE